MKRCVLIVLDSVGIGELPDAIKYGDVGTNTLCNIKNKISELKISNMENLGLGNIDGVSCFDKVQVSQGCFGKMAEKSEGKDTTTGHWEISGITLEKAFPVYPNGFPDDVMNKFQEAIGTKTIGNIVASGTEIIKNLGEEHVKTGYPIIYTSADSVFQIAAHEDVINIKRLYEMCEIARNLLMGDHAVGRVIARPFNGEIGDFKRTENRKDFSLEPQGQTILDLAVKNGYLVKAVGKIEDIFCNRGITHSVHTHVNNEGIEQTIKYIKEDFSGIIFTNLVDFDMLYGHRNDALGYANALNEFDKRIPEIINNLKDDDILIITADHGCDPTTKGTDHTREYVPLIVYGKKLKQNINLGIRESFADIAATMAEYLQIDLNQEKLNQFGKSFYSDIVKV